MFTRNLSSTPLVGEKKYEEQCLYSTAQNIICHCMDDIYNTVNKMLQVNYIYLDLISMAY
jgi:hypothetical protein